MTLSKDFPLDPSWCTPFFCRLCFHGEICKTKWMQNECCSQYNKKCQFCFPNFSKKTWSAEKMEYTRTKPAEKPSKLSKLVQFSIFSGHPLVYLIKFNQSTIRA